jgi:transcriptional regulator GlxA family with amidase domain
MYLHGKVLELLAWQLGLAAPRDRATTSQLKPQTLDRIYAARDILIAKLDSPPTISELAHQVGVSERTLQKGFQSLDLLQKSDREIYNR